MEIAGMTENFSDKGRKIPSLIIYSISIYLKLHK